MTIYFDSAATTPSVKKNLQPLGQVAFLDKKRFINLPLLYNLSYQKSSKNLTVNRTL